MTNLPVIPRRYKEYALAYIKIAEKDLERARDALNRKDYAQCAFYAQQCIDKSVKAMLELKLFYTREHDILPYFVEKFKEEWKEGFNIIVEALDETRGVWLRSRYPFEIEERVVIPEEYYDLEKVKKFIIYAEKVFRRT